MATSQFQRHPLSGAADGAPILIAATSSPGTTIHTATSSTTLEDEIYLWAYNDHTADLELVLQFGGTSGVNNIRKTIETKSGLVLVVPGLILRNSLALLGYCATTNVIAVSGFVNRGVS